MGSKSMDSEDLMNHLEKQSFIKMELKTKKSQLKDMRTQFSTLQQENKQLQFVVNDLSRDNLELERNLAVALEHRTRLEGKLRELCESKAKIARQVNGLATENKTLKKQLTEAETANSEYKREVEDCKSQIEYNTLYKADLTDKHTKTKGFMFSIQEKLKALDLELKELSIDHIAYQNLKKDLMSIESYKQDLERVNNENNNLQAEIIFFKAKCRQLELLLAHCQSMKPNEETEFFFNEWKNCLKKITEQSKSHNLIIEVLNKKVKCESDSTTIYQNREEKYLAEIASLKEKIKQYQEKKVVTEGNDCEEIVKDNFIFVDEIGEELPDTEEDEFIANCL